MISLATSPPRRDGMLRTLSGSLRVLRQLNEYMYSVELELLDDRLTANNWRYMNLERHRPLFRGIPILIAYVKGQGGTKIGDGHNMREKTGRNGERYFSFTDPDSERIIGYLSENDADIRVENRDGNKWIVGKGTIWAWYAREAVEKIAEQGRMDISIETLVTESRMEGKEEIEEAYTPLGATILGDDVPPAVRGAHIRPVNAQDFQALKVRAASCLKAPGKSENAEKGVRRMGNKRMEKLRRLFPDREVIAMSEDGMTVALLNRENGELSGHRFAEGLEDVVRENDALEAGDMLSLHLSNGEEIQVPYERVLGRQSEIVADLRSILEAASKEAESARERVKALETAERKRRVSAAREAVRREFDEINRMLADAGEEEMEASACNEIMDDIDNGVYTDMENESGEWCGAERACADLKARSMDHMKRNAKKRRLAETVYAWSDNVLRGSDAETDPIEKLLSDMHVNAR